MKTRNEIAYQIGRHVCHTFYRESFNEWLKGSDNIPADDGGGKIGQEYRRNVLPTCDPILPFDKEDERAKIYERYPLAQHER